jgi:hypothetical protein
MASNTQVEEVKTVFSGDASGVVDASDKATKGLSDYVKKLEEANNKAKQARSQGHGNNLTAGFKDLAEGRTMFALSRLGAAFGVGGGLTAGLMVAQTVAKRFGEAIETATEGASKLREQLDGMREGYNSGERTRLTSSDPKSILGVIEHANKQEKDLREVQNSLNPYSGEGEGVIDQVKRFRDPKQIGAFGRHMMQRFGAYFDNPSAGFLDDKNNALTELRGEVGQQLGAVGSQRESARKKFSELISENAQNAESRLTESGGFNAQRNEVRRAMQDQMNEATMAGAGGKETLENIRRIHQATLDQIDAEERLANVRTNRGQMAVDLEGKFLSQRSRVKQASQNEVQSAMDNLSAVQSRFKTGSAVDAARQQLQRAQQNERRRLFDLEYTEDGHRRHGGEIARQHRIDRQTDARLTRAQARFDREHNRTAGDNMAMLRRTHQRPGDAFPQRKQDEAKGIEILEKSMTEVRLEIGKQTTLLRDRLPSQTT